jgi:hypothetical protein
MVKNYGLSAARIASPRQIEHKRAMRAHYDCVRPSPAINKSVRSAISKFPTLSGP